MKKLLSLVCIVASLAFVFSRPLTIEAASEHATETVEMSYFLGSVSSRYDWDYYYGEYISFSAGNSTASGLGIYADTYMYKNADDLTHDYLTNVTRGLSAGGSAGGGVGVSVGGNISWTTDTFYVALTNRGDFLFSHDPSFE